jgi:hypothetical protein
MKQNPLLSEEAAQFTMLVYQAFHESKDNVITKIIFLETLKAAHSIEKAFAENKKLRTEVYLKYSQDYWTKVKSMLLIALNMKLCSAAQSAHLLEKIAKIQKIATGLIRHLKNKKIQVSGQTH